MKAITETVARVALPDEVAALLPGVCGVAVYARDIGEVFVGLDRDQFAPAEYAGVVNRAQRHPSGFFQGEGRYFVAVELVTAGQSARDKFTQAVRALVAAADQQRGGN